MSFTHKQLGLISDQFYNEYNNAVRRHEKYPNWPKPSKEFMQALIDVAEEADAQLEQEEQQ